MRETTTADVEAAIGTPQETSVKLDYTLACYGRLEVKLAEARRERDRYRAALEDLIDRQLDYPTDRSGVFADSQWEAAFDRARKALSAVAFPTHERPRKDQ